MTADTASPGLPHPTTNNPTNGLHSGVVSLLSTYQPSLPIPPTLHCSQQIFCYGVQSSASWAIFKVSETRTETQHHSE